MPSSREWTLDGHAGRLTARTWQGEHAPSHVVLRVYPGARHEVFNEVNADEVLSEVTSSIGEALGAPRG